jgi:hypothetical protein
LLAEGSAGPFQGIEPFLDDLPGRLRRADWLASGVGQVQISGFNACRPYSP